MSTMSGSMTGSMADWIRAMEQGRSKDRDTEAWIKIPDEDFRAAIMNHIAEIEDRLQWIDERLESAERRAGVE